jgi:hypothetical protein
MGLRVSLAAIAALLAPAFATAGPVHHGKAAVHTAVRHAIHHAPAHRAPPRRSVHRSTPRRAATHHAPPVRRTVVIRPTTRNFRSSVVARTTVNRYSSRGYHRRSSYHRAYGGARHSYSSGRYRWRSSRYSRRHVNRNNSQTIVRGVLNNTIGMAANGSIQVKVVNGNANRFQFGVVVTAPQSAPLRTYQVNNATRYTMITAANGKMRASSFKELQAGEPVMILVPQRGLLAQAVEIFPAK